MAYSCNTAFAKMAVELGPEKMREQAEAFGFNSDYLDDLSPQVQSVYPPASRADGERGAQRRADRADRLRPVRGAVDAAADGDGRRRAGQPWHADAALPGRRGADAGVRDARDHRAGRDPRRRLADDRRPGHRPDGRDGRQRHRHAGADPGRQRRRQDRHRAAGRRGAAAVRLVRLVRTGRGRRGRGRGDDPGGTRQGDRRRPARRPDREGSDGGGPERPDQRTGQPEQFTPTRPTATASTPGSPPAGWAWCGGRPTPGSTGRSRSRCSSTSTPTTRSSGPASTPRPATPPPSSTPASPASSTTPRTRTADGSRSPYLVMELVEGQPLSALLARPGTRPHARPGRRARPADADRGRARGRAPRPPSSTAT